MTFTKGGVSEPKSDPMVLFMRKVVKQPDGCWRWTGAVDTRAHYGIFTYWDWDGKRYSARAHRWLYKQKRGPLTREQLLDHTCHNEAYARGECAGGIECLHRRCVNPEHLVIATHQENILRGAGQAALNAAKTHCPRNHPYSGDNLMISKTGGRVCRACNRERCREYYHRTKAQRLGLAKLESGRVRTQDDDGER
jgi:hypothetical protein